MKTQKKINDIQELINQNVEKHLKIANEEMGVIQKDIVLVKSDIAEIKTHIEWIKNVYGDWEKRWDKLDNRIWLVLATIIIGFLANIYFR